MLRNQSPLPDGDGHSKRASADQAIAGSSRPTSVSGTRAKISKKIPSKLSGQ